MGLLRPEEIEHHENDLRSTDPQKERHRLTCNIISTPVTKDKEPPQNSQLCCGGGFRDCGRVLYPFVSQALEKMSLRS